MSVPGLLYTATLALTTSLRAPVAQFVAPTVGAGAIDRRAAAGVGLGRRAAAGVGLATLLAAAAAPAASVERSYADLAAEAYAAFEAADYRLCERKWQAATAAYPSEPLGWNNLAIALVINASDEMKLGEPPAGRARERLDEALAALARAEALSPSADALLLNARGNAFGLLLRWEDALGAYSASAAASPADFASIPRSNEALALFQLSQLELAERKARALVRRDPNFRDGVALVATLRWAQGDAAGATTEFAALCSGTGGRQWCERYGSASVVTGRWSPKAVAAYEELLKQPSIQLELRNARAL